MGLRRWISVLLLGTLSLLAVLMLVTLRWDTQQQAARLEEVEARGEMLRLMATLEARTLEVNGALKSWANWTELYKHLEKPDPRFSRDELSAQALVVAHVDLLTLLDANGNVVEMVEVPGPGGQRPATTQAAQNAQVYSAYFQLSLRSQGCGSIQASQQLALVCFSPALDSEGRGEPRGYVLMGRWVNEAMLQDITRQTGVVFRLIPKTGATLTATANGRTGAMFGAQDIRVQVSAQTLELSAPVFSIFGRQVAEIQMSWPRKYARAAAKTYDTTQALLILLIVVCGVLLVWLLERLVVRRLNRLSRELGALVASPELAGQVTVHGQDEISDLAGYAQKLIDRVRSQMEELKDLSQTDTLTGLPNRRAFNERVEHLLALHHRQQLPVALILIDVDYFKKYNDRYGHPAGDEALKRLADCLRSTLRRELDMPVRMGGEEFGVLLEGASLEQASTTAETLRSAVQALAVAHEDSPAQGVMSISLGVAVVGPRDNVTTLYRRADEALYQAKARGRNQVVTK